MNMKLKTALIAGVCAMMASTSYAADKANIALGLGGSMTQWIGAASQADSFETANTTNYSSVDSKSDSEIWITGEGTLDNGLGLGAVVQLRSDAGDTGVDESYLYLTGNFGEVRAGSTSHAAAVLGVDAPDVGLGIGGTGSDTNLWVIQPTNNLATTNVLGATDKNNKVVYYSPSFGGISVAGSYAPDNNSVNNDDLADTTVATSASTFSGVVAYDAVYANGVSTSTNVSYVGIDSNVTTDNGRDIVVGASVGYDKFTVGGSYRDMDRAKTTATSTNGFAYDIGVAYDVTDGHAISASYLRSEVEGTVATAANDVATTYMVSSSYNLGAGVNWLTSGFIVNYDDETTTAANNNKGYALITGVSVNF